ncbi:MAG: right-handed parallel beta-helix repeat-containing protein [Clostridia bacterium]|nr:right-handed parallel beta-helix repeat-containing protein [Clostridia bacterium]
MKNIDLSACGIRPGGDCTEELNRILAQNREDCEFVFAPGDYRITPHIQRDLALSNTDVIPTRQLGILLEGMKNVRLTGSGARLLCEGRMQPFTLLGCEDVTLTGFTIDWEKPMVAEGIVTAFTDSSIDLYIDPAAFPHRVEDGTLWFDIGGGEWSRFTGWTIQFDAVTRTVRRTSGDRFSFGALLSECGGHVYRFAANRPDTAVGNIVVLRHNEREHAGIFAENCRNIAFEHIDIHSCGGLGCLIQFCDTVSFRAVSFLPNREAGRFVSGGRDDGMHVTCCSGTVTVDGCSFLGLMDDPINVHGCCVTGAAWLDERTLCCRFMHEQARGFRRWAEAGDDIVFIDRRPMTQIAHAVAASYTLGEDGTFLLSFTEAPDEEIRRRDPSSLALDNLTHTAAFVCENNRFGSCRARGVLVSTPKPVCIRNNYFESSGSAILVAGDANGWFESGECHDVEIAGNVFTDSCLSSMYQFCEGVISVCPVVPEPDREHPFHKNIRIHDNVFDSPDVPVLYAFSCNGLTFSDNQIYQSPRAEKWHPGKAMIRLESCRNVVIGPNTWTGDFGGMQMISED